MTPLRVRASSSADEDPCVEIVRGLPEFFTSDVPEKIPGDLAHHLGWVLEENGNILGFVIVDRRTERSAEILWAAIHADRRNQGLGTLLVDRALDELAAEGICVVLVKTLDESSTYEPYEHTRAFWTNRGFVHTDSIDPLPGWQPGNPAGIYVAALATTRNPG